MKSSSLSLLNSTYGELAPINRVKSLIEEEVNPDRIADFAKQVAAAQRIDNENLTRSNYWSELLIWSRLRLVELLTAGQKDGSIRPNGVKLSHSGKAISPQDIIQKNAKSRATKLANLAGFDKEAAKVDRERIEEAIEEIRSKPDGQVTMAAVTNLLQRKSTLVKSIPREIPDSIPGVHNCSFTELDIPSNSVRLIFTDPPYDCESLPMYADMLKMASDVLVDGGSCLCYCGHLHIDKIIRYGIDAGLRFYWVCACLHVKKALMPRSGIRVGWKPILWFTKGERFDTGRVVHDCRLDPAEKESHAWQQSIDEAKSYIETLSDPGDLVFDPFCGSGTTSVAAIELGRRYLTCDVDADAISVAIERINDAKR